MLATAARDLHDVLQAIELSRAASVLGRQRAGYTRNRGRSKPRRWTGYLGDGTRAWFGQRVFLPNGTLGFICAVLRGEVVARWDDPHSVEAVQFGLFQADEVRPYHLPAARLMGQAKLGTQERKSERKARAARINGRMPTRPGRRRGRPRAALPSST
jgi:hypothetical protein